MDDMLHIYVFGLGDILTGSKFLKEAAVEGHYAAIYVMSILYVRLKLIMKVPYCMVPADVYYPDGIDFDSDELLGMCRVRVMWIISLVGWITWNKFDVKLCTQYYCRKVVQPGFTVAFCSDICRWNCV